MKWTTDTIIAGTALFITAAGSVMATAIHWGSTEDRVTHIEQSQKVMNDKLDVHQSELADTKTHNAVVEQKLDDVIHRLDRMEKKL